MLAREKEQLGIALRSPTNPQPHIILLSAVTGCLQAVTMTGRHVLAKAKQTTMMTHPFESIACPALDQLQRATRDEILQPPALELYMQNCTSIVMSKHCLSL